MTVPSSTEESPPGEPPDEKGTSRQGGPQDSLSSTTGTLPDTGMVVNEESGESCKKATEEKDWYFKVPARLVRDNAMSVQARFLWIVIRSYEGAGRPAFPSLERLEEITGIHRQTIQKYLRELEKTKKLIRFRQRKKDGEYLSSRYRTIGGPQTKISSMDETDPKTNLPTTVNTSTIVFPSERQRGRKTPPASASLKATQAVSDSPSSHGEKAQQPKPEKRKWL